MNTSSVEVSPKKRAKLAKARRREDARWAARSGPVTVTKMAPESLPPQ